MLALISLLGLIASRAVNFAPESLGPPLLWRKILLTVALLVGFAATFEIVGYLAATFLFVICLLRGVERKRWMEAGLVAFCAALISYILFGLLLGAPLPAGFLGA